MQTLLILRGYPGSGKTTVGCLLQERGIGTFIDHNKILTFLADMTGDDIGIYKEIHALELAMARKLLGEGRLVIVARGFSTHRALDPYTSMAAETNSRVIIVRLEASLDLLERRVQSPERKMGFNPTTTVIALREYVTTTPLEYIAGERVVDVSKSLSAIVYEIEKSVAP